jgi:hypothetical protein
MKGTLQSLPDDFSVFLLNSFQSMATTVLVCSVKKRHPSSPEKPVPVAEAAAAASAGNGNSFATAIDHLLMHPPLVPYQKSV